MSTFYMIRWRQRQSEKPYGFFGTVIGAARSRRSRGSHPGLPEGQQ